MRDIANGRVYIRAASEEGVAANGLTRKRMSLVVLGLAIGVFILWTGYKQSAGEPARIVVP